MSWITLTANDITDAKMAPLVYALRTAATDPDQGDPVDNLVGKAVASIRQEIATGGHVVSEDTAKIPVSLVDVAARWVVWLAKDRLELEPTKIEEMQHREDMALLREIASGKRGVEMPEDAVTPETTTSTGIEVVSYRARQATRENLSGLM